MKCRAAGFSSVSGFVMAPTVSRRWPSRIGTTARNGAAAGCVAIGIGIRPT